jgi:Ankyrin repeats (many copies)/Ankyrin repeat
LALSASALGQEGTSNIAVTIAPNTIASIPPIARAVLSGDRERVLKAIEEFHNVDEQVRAKEGERAGFTPLILAAAVSDADTAQVLIKYGAKITILDDFNRSALWYAAVRQDVAISETLVKAPGSKDVINTADADLKRTPLHIAVRGAAPQLVSLLLNFGASKDQKDILGNTPLDYCQRTFTEACRGFGK